MVLVWKMRADRSFHEVKAQIQATVSSHKEGDKEAIKKAFEDMREAFFPYAGNQRKEEERQMQERMMRWISTGPLLVRPERQDPREAQKLRSKLARGQAAAGQREELRQQGRLQRMDPAHRIRQRVRGAS